MSENEEDSKMEKDKEISLTIKDLKEIIENLPDDMVVLGRGYEWGFDDVACVEGSAYRVDAPDYAGRYADTEDNDGYDKVTSDEFKVLFIS